MVLVWTLAKEEEYYFDLSFRKGRPQTITIELAVVWLCVNSNSVSLWVWRVIIPWLLIWHIIVGVGRQYRQPFRRTFSKYSFNKPPRRQGWRNDPIWYRSLDQTLNALWDTRFEQCEPPTEDKVVQINLGDEANLKPIFISESLSPSELSLIHIWRCRRSTLCRSRWSPYH